MKVHNLAPPKRGPHRMRGMEEGEGYSVGKGPQSKRIPKKPTERSVVGFTGSSLLWGGGGPGWN